MESESGYDEWSTHIHAVITFLKPFFDDWKSYASMVSALLGVGVLIMENQVLLRMRMGRWEIGGYALWCIISSVLGPIFDIVVMLGLLAYCRQKSNRMHITHDTIAKALMPPPVAANYRVMGAVCIVATVLTLCSNVLYMLRGWEEPLPFYDWAAAGTRWMTSQIWYAIGMIFLFHLVTRPAQSGVVLFGKFPRDLWAYKWQLGVLYLPVHYILLKLCDAHRDSSLILIPLEIVVDVVLYNGPFLLIMLRLLFLGWKVAYDEAVLTGAIYEDDGQETPNILDLFMGRTSTGPGPGSATTARPTSRGYVGLAMVDLDEAEQGQSRVAVRTGSGGGFVGRAAARTGSSSPAPSASSQKGHGKAYDSPSPSPPSSPSKGNNHGSSRLSPPRVNSKLSPMHSPKTSPKNSSPLRNVIIFSMDSTDEEDDEDEDEDVDKKQLLL